MKSIYGLKQASRQWHLKFNDIIVFFGFKKNIVERDLPLKWISYLRGLVLGFRSRDTLVYTKKKKKNLAGMDCI